MRPICCVFSRPISVHVAPPFSDLYTPAPGSIVLRELGSPVPAHTVFVSDGAMASMPIEMMFLSSKIGRQVTPLFVLFQMPPPAAATKRVLEGPGMPTTSESRPWKLPGPTVRHLKPAVVAESRVCAPAAVAPASSARAARVGVNRLPSMRDD